MTSLTSTSSNQSNAVNPQMALEADIRRIQERKDPFTTHIPEEKLKKIIAQTVQDVLPQLVVCAQLQKNLHENSLAATTALLLSTREQQSGVNKTDQSFNRIIQTLKHSDIGQELLMRVMFTAAAISSQLPIPLSSSATDIHEATAMLAARPLQQAIMTEALNQEDLLNKSRPS